MVPTPQYNCSHTDCAFECDDDNTFAAHRTQSSSDGTRWECPGCKKKFCAFEAMDNESTHNNACIKLRDFVKKAKYGQTRLKIFCEWSQAERDSGARSGHNKKTSTKKQPAKPVTTSRRTAAGVGDKWTVNGANKTTIKRVDAREDCETENGEDSEVEFEEEEFEVKKKTNSSGTTASKPPVESWYGCSVCDTVGRDLERATIHAAQSNEDMQRWNCHGCQSIYCEKAALIEHIETCPWFKEWMKENDLMWPFRTSSAVLNMANESTTRGDGVLSTFTALTSFRVKAMKAKEAATDLYVSQVIWDDEGWKGVLTIDPRML